MKRFVFNYTNKRGKFIRRTFSIVSLLKHNCIAVHNMMVVETNFQFRRCRFVRTINVCLCVSCVSRYSTTKSTVRWAAVVFGHCLPCRSSLYTHKGKYIIITNNNNNNILRARVQYKALYNIIHVWRV